MVHEWFERDVEEAVYIRTRNPVLMPTVDDTTELSSVSNNLLESRLLKRTAPEVDQSPRCVAKRLSKQIRR